MLHVNGKMDLEKVTRIFDSKGLSPRIIVGCAVTAMALLILVFNLRNMSSLSFPMLTPTKSSVTTIKTSHIHYLIPSTLAKPPVCASIASALVNRYPIPVIVGYKGEDEFDSGKAHIAKILAIQRYLNGLVDSADDDLIMIMDSFDVLAQLPVEVMIQRYFDIAAKADQRLADQRGLTVEEVHEKGLRQTILFGAGKICSPDDVRCYLVPYSGLPRYAYGPHTDENNVIYVDSRHLNSGTVIAPLGDLRKLIDDTQRMINETYDMKNLGRNKDQFYLSTIYARQEYQRTLDMNGGEYPSQPDDPMLRDQRRPDKKQGVNDTTEYHVFVDFDSTFTQTQCYNEHWIRNLKYDRHDLTTSIVNDPYDEGRLHIRPFRIQMPALIFRAMTRMFFSLPESERLYMKSKNWVQSLLFGTNIGTEVIYSFYHNTCNKDDFMKKYQSLWFYPLVQPLLRVARQAIQDKVPLHPEIVDGRIWMAPRQYPVNHTNDEYGGVFTDFEAEPYIPFTQLCQENITEVLRTQRHKDSLIH